MANVVNNWEKRELTFQMKTNRTKCKNIVQTPWLYAPRLPVQINLADRAELWTRAEWPPAMFSQQACSDDLWCYFPFHTSVRGQTRPPPLHREAFVLQRHSMSGLGMTSKEKAYCPSSKQFRNRVKWMWFMRNCPVSSPRNEAREVINYPN